METIIVGYDGSEEAKRALERAAELTATFDSRLIVVCIVPLPVAAAAPGAIAEAQELERECEAHLERAQAILSNRRVQAEYLQKLGQPAQAIVDLAEWEKADLVVTGTRDPGFLERLLAGSVSEAVARRAPCDVLIVH